MVNISSKLAALKKKIALRKESKVQNDVPNLKSLSLLIKKAKDAYYNTEKFYIVPKHLLLKLPSNIQAALVKSKSEVTDAVYDLAEDLLKELDPNNKVLSVGAAVKKEKVRLPFPLPSLNKRKPDTLNDWASQYDGMYVVTDKIDGVSLGIQNFDKNTRKLYTRGDGEWGGDISFMADALGIPRFEQKLNIRAEIVMPLAMFKKWEKDFANPRNMVSGITNRNSVHKAALGHCKVLAYQIIGSSLPQSKQLALLKRLGFEVPWYKVLDDVSVSSMTSLLKTRKAKAGYEIDGLVISRDEPAKITQSNPTHMVAFKDNEAEEHAETEVTEVAWRHTRTGVLFPRVMIKPVKLKGVTVTFASGKSGMTIKKNKIGPGAIISIARSGDVIPDIREVVRPALKAQLPNVPYRIQGEHFFAEGEAEDGVVQYLEFFFAQIGVEHFKSATLTKVVEAGYDTVAKIHKMSKKKLVTLTSKRGESIYDDIHDDDPIELATLMYASQQFGRAMGSTRLRAIVKAIPDILEKNHKNLTQKIDDIPGFDLKTANMFVMNLPKFKEWMKDCPYEYILEEEKEVLGTKCKGHKVLFTGFRDANLQSLIEKQSGEVVSAITKATVLLASDPDGTSSKIKAARDKKIPIMTKSEYIKKFKL